MDSKKIGNDITANALQARDTSKLREKALIEIANQHGWQEDETDSLFLGVFYDSKKVGSYITRAKNDKGESAVIKLQLQKVKYDEGFIIGHVNKENRSKRVRLPKILLDQPWNEKTGYGYIIFEDLSRLPNLWPDVTNITKEDKQRHKEFLAEFFSNVLPISPFIEKPGTINNKGYIEWFDDFYEIMKNSDHHHIEITEINKIRDVFYKIVDRCNFSDLHFTHAHLSGLDVKYDPAKNEFIPLANLYWSWRPKYYEISFPIWINLMHTHDEKFSFDKLQKLVGKWTSLWEEGLYDHNPLKTDQFWFNLFTQVGITVMLDIGSAEWKPGEEKEKQALLDSMHKYFYFLAKEKFSV